MDGFQEELRKLDVKRKSLEAEIFELTCMSDKSLPALSESLPLDAGSKERDTDTKTDPQRRQGEDFTLPATVDDMAKKREKDRDA